MTLSQSERMKPHVALCTIGHVDHGKATLTAAISKVLSLSGDGEVRTVAPEDRSLLHYLPHLPHIEYNTQTCHYALFDASDFATSMSHMIRMDGAILVVAAPDGPMPQTREHILLASQLGVSSMIVYLDKVDQVDNEELLDLVELEVRELLSMNDFPGNEVPVIRGSAQQALESDSGEREASEYGSIVELMDAMVEYVPTPARLVDRPFLMPVEDVFDIEGRGIVAIGRIQQGVVNSGEEVEIVGLTDTRTTVVTGIEMFKKTLSTGEAGDNVGCLLRGIDRDEIARGQVLAVPESITPHTVFEARVDFLSKEQSGHPGPFLDGYRPRFYIHTAAGIDGSIGLPEGVEMVIPGDDSVTMTVRLIQPLAIYIGLVFGMRETPGRYARTIGNGIITKIIE